MDREARLQLLVAEATALEHKPLVADEKAMLEARTPEATSLAIKILSVAGGLFASIAFAAALFISGIYESSVSLGVLCVLSLGCAVWLNYFRDRVIFDTFTVCLFLLGLTFLAAAIAAANSNVSEQGLLLPIALVSAIVLLLARRPVLIFTAALLLNVALFTLMTVTDALYFLPWYLSALSVLLTFFFLYEGRIIVSHRLFLHWYRPLRAALIFSLIGGLILNANWVGSFLRPIGNGLLFPVMAGCICWLLYRLFVLLPVYKIQHRILLLALSILLLLPTYFYPPLTGAILLLLLGFRNNNRLCFSLGVLFFIYAISRFYYELHTTLLVKSLLLMGSGVLLLTLYFFTQKKLKDEAAV